ncbi:response regulator transcription factor [Actinocatenispora comari]|uniref:DNA-binding response regulator n=1 Tax=Actinocatenispora comari TaxID=2807577 RepID=A0A8J4A956_9ACTN|nr:response regulator transcription factor [Actinocatenispora comari]GIL26548.1 DNA-binding response regulator [Actinocatenispora comari]
MIRILLAEDQHLVRGALSALLGLEPDLTIVAEAADGAAAVAAAREHRPDVALLDIEMPVLSGIEATEQLRAAVPETRALILTTFGRPGYLRRAMDAGARGFVVKDSPPAELAAAIRRVAAGEVVLDPALAVASLGAGPSPLTERERDVLAAGADGASVAQIADVLALSGGTVRNYLSSAIGKTGARNRTEAARIARDNGWL